LATLSTSASQSTLRTMPLHQLRRTSTYRCQLPDCSVNPVLLVSIRPKLSPAQIMGMTRRPELLLNHNAPYSCTS
jgi:hypothetical protein